MNCPVCSTPLESKSGETVTEIPVSGAYSRHTISYWHSYTCPSCRRSTGPRGAEEYARKSAEAWKEQAA